MLKQRLLTAAILIPLLLAVLFVASPTQFYVVMFMVSLWAAWEWAGLMEIQDVPVRLLYVFAMGLVLVKALMMPILPVLVVAAIWWVVAIVMIVRYAYGYHSLNRNFVMRGMIGMLVLVPCLVALCYIRRQEQGQMILLFLFALVCGADTVAYFVGKQWGKNKLAPLVSPQKSIQGLVGALVFAVLLTSIVLWMSHAPFMYGSLVMGAILGIVLISVVGDLFESM